MASHLLALKAHILKKILSICSRSGKFVAALIKLFSGVPFYPHVVHATPKEMASPGCAVVVVTHDPNVASAADAIIFIRDGRITHVAGSMAPKEILDGMKEHESETDHA